MPLPEHLYERPKSLTVSVLAWCGIVGGVLGCLGIAAMFVSGTGLPPVGRLLGAPAALAAAIGLRNRRNWARLSYIGVTGLGFVATPFTVIRAQLPPAVWFALVPVLAVQGFIVYKLCSRDVREEFGVEE